MKLPSRERWAELKKHLGDRLYQPIDLPEFSGIPVMQPCAERWAMMANHIEKQARKRDPYGAAPRAIDIGCHTGWFCRALAARDYFVVGIERSPELAEVAEALSHIHGSQRTRIECGDALTTVLPVRPTFNVALCLSVAMYLFDDVGAGWDFMHRLATSIVTDGVLFFDFGGMYAHRLPFDETNIIDQFIERLPFKRGELLGRTPYHGDTPNESRPLYAFWKSS